MNYQRILVTGGAGVIGSQLVPLLAEAGHSVTVIDLKRKPEHFSDSVSYYRSNLLELSQDSFDKIQPEIVIHLAATFERSIESIEFYEDNFQNNITVSHRVLSLCANSNKVRRLVFASSYLVYDSKQYLFENPQDKPTILGPSSELKPRNLIGMAKLAHEIELEFYAQFESTTFSILIARIYRGFGLGSRDVISRWVRSARDGEPLTVFNPEGIFDYIYCKDSAVGLFKLALETDYSGVVDLGTGNSRSVLSIVKAIKSSFPDLVIIEEATNQELEASQADIDKLFELLRWKPSYSLEEAINEVVEYERNQSPIGDSNT